MVASLEYRVQGSAVSGGEAEVQALGVRVPLDATWGTPPGDLPGTAQCGATTADRTSCSSTRPVPRPTANGSLLS